MYRALVMARAVSKGNPTIELGRPDPSTSMCGQPSGGRRPALRRVRLYAEGGAEVILNGLSLPG
ncbi:hypothetical protein ACFWVU_06170 [Streptomyces sp. NPDC058686]|uniref:hypothetical protein n=1 Tax=Streptomyces sp. NPDC058686 TaxID=3346599 RepID=UPI0036610169